MKKAFPVSLEETMIEWVKEEVSKGTFRNRSHLVEQALKDFRNQAELGTLTKYV